MTTLLPAELAQAARAGGGSLRTILLRGNVLWVSVVSLLTDLASEMMNLLLPVFVAGPVPVGATASTEPRRMSARRRRR